jgi:hypothetical protein
MNAYGIFYKQAATAASAYSTSPAQSLAARATSRYCRSNRTPFETASLFRRTGSSAQASGKGRDNGIVLDYFIASTSGHAELIAIKRLLTVGLQTDPVKLTVAIQLLSPI